jgi:hypothetical protein
MQSARAEYVRIGAWFALAVPSDPDHASAKAFIGTNRERFLTTDFVIDELLTLFRVRRQFARAIQWVDDVYQNRGFDLLTVSPDDFTRALEMYRKFSDKQWSFTDCASFAVMERLDVTRAFSFDDHFRQFGALTILPRGRSR